jgi:hypothetical protein
MDARLSSLKRQYAIEPDDQLAHQIAVSVLRSEPEENLNFEQKIQKYKDSVQIMEAELGGSISHELQKLMEKDPTIEGIRWEQYTPYFNDGDACIFGVMDARVKFKDNDEEGGDYGDGYLSSWDFGSWNGDKRVYSEEEQSKAAIVEDISKFVANIPSDLLLNAFGDHTQITINKDGVDTEHYDHE